MSDSKQLEVYRAEMRQELSRRVDLVNTLSREAVGSGDFCSSLTYSILETGGEMKVGVSDENGKTCRVVSVESIDRRIRSLQSLLRRKLLSAIPGKENLKPGDTNMHTVGVSTSSEETASVSLTSRQMELNNCLFETTSIIQKLKSQVALLS